MVIFRPITMLYKNSDTVPCYTHTNTHTHTHTHTLITATFITKYLYIT
jgi:hypothetical protein